MKHGLILLAWLLTGAAPVFSQTQIQDADGDTRVQTEAAPDEDRIRFRVAGVDVLVFRRTASGFILFENFANGANVFLGEKAGEASTAGGANVFVGFSAGKANTEAGFNTFVGAQSGFTNTTGALNTFLGANAGFLNTTGGSNVFLGDSAGVKNTTASFNTFVGHAAGRDNTTFSGNTFIGANAGVRNATGDAHVFIGKNAGAATVNNSSNTYVGSDAGMASTSGSNTFIGALAGRNNSTGGGNTFLGTRAGQNTTTGINNTFVGDQTGLNILSGNNNVAVGKLTGNNFNSNNGTFLGFTAGASVAGLSNATALGNGTIVNASNKVRLGNTAVTVVEGNVAYTVSDGRFKSDLKNDAPGLAFVMGLRPVTYHFNYTDFSRFLGEESVDYGLLVEKEQARELGFVAQEVERLCAEQGVTVSNLVHVPESAADNYSVAYGQLVVPIVQAMQEQQAEIAAQQAEIVELRMLVNQLLTAGIPTAGQSPGLDFQIRPNPATDLLYISLPAAVPSGATFSLLAADGALLRTMPARTGEQTLEIRALPPGNYVVQLTVPGRAAATKIAVKAR